MRIRGVAVAALLGASRAYELDINSPDSIREVAGQMTDDMMLFYDGHLPGGTPGLLPLPYYCLCSAPWP